MGEHLRVTKIQSHAWLKSVHLDLRGGYMDSNVYSADEAGVFYDVTPDNILKFKDEKRVGVNLQK